MWASCHNSQDCGGSMGTDGCIRRAFYIRRIEECKGRRLETLRSEPPSRLPSIVIL